MIDIPSIFQFISALHKKIVLDAYSHLVQVLIHMKKASQPKFNLLIRNGYILAGLSNLVGVLVFSKVFSNPELCERYPEVFSNFGLFVIILWGLAFIAVSNHWSQQRNLAAVFALEKTAYVVSWIYWLSNHSPEIPSLFTQSPLTAIFYLTYGPNDLVFLGLFTWAFFKADSD